MGVAVYVIVPDAVESSPPCGRPEDEPLVAPEATAWLPSHGAIDGADLAIAATALLLNARLLTLNVWHFPMLPDLRPAY